MTSRDFANKRVLVLGLGLHGGGLATARWLVKHRAQVTVSDLKTRQALAPSINKLRGLPIKYVLGSHPLSLLNGCELIVQNPGVPADAPILRAARRRRIPIENEASLFLKLCPTKHLVAVTGTRGKSTTVSLLGAILRYEWPRVVVAGNIRDTVLLDVLDKLTPRSRVVLELSSWQLEIIGQHKLRVPIAVITNILPDHLNRYASFRDYVKAKSMIFKHQLATDSLILNFDNPVTRRFKDTARAKVYLFSSRHRVVNGCYESWGVVFWSEAGRRKKMFATADLLLPGRHNLMNALAAVSAAKLMGAHLSAIQTAIKKFAGLHDRLELVRNWRGVSYYNDTTATSPDATIAALQALAKSVVLIAGGTDKNLSYHTLARAIKQSVSALILLPGTATVKLQHELRNYKKILLAKSMAQAVKLASQLTPANGIVLLSPGAASFGLFKHEFERGEEFCRAVKQLK